MTRMPLIERLGRVGPSVLLVMAATVPVLCVATPPMIDVLGHIGRYELQTGLASDPWLRAYYAFEWQVIGNLGADLIVQALHPVLGTVRAAKLALLLVPLLTASAILLLSRGVHGRVTPFAVVALTLIYALPFTWGFLNFSLSMALALLAFTLWLRLGRSKSRPALFAPLSLAIWLCHTFGWAFLGILCTADSVTRERLTARSWPQVLLRVVCTGLPLLAPLVPMLLWRSSAPGAGISGWFDFSQKAGWLIGTQRLSWEWADKLCGCLLLVLIVAGTATRHVRADPGLALAATIAFAAFLFLPKQIFGSVFADMRLAPYAVMLALLAMRDTDISPRVRSVLMLLAVAFLGFRLALTAHVYRAREQMLDAHLAALDVIPRHARLATLVEVPCQAEWTLPWFSHIGSVALVRRHAFANDQWANASMNPLRVRFPAAGAYATDDKQLFFPERCAIMPTLKQALAALPARAFTHVWIVGVAPAGIPRHPDLLPVWQRRDAAVFAVGAHALQGNQRIRKLSKLQP